MKKIGYKYERLTGDNSDEAKRQEVEFQNKLMLEILLKALDIALIKKKKIEDEYTALFSLASEQMTKLYGRYSAIYNVDMGISEMNTKQDLLAMEIVHTRKLAEANTNMDERKAQLDRANQLEMERYQLQTELYKAEKTKLQNAVKETTDMVSGLIDGSLNISEKLKSSASDSFSKFVSMLMTKTPTSELDLLQEISENTAKAAKHAQELREDAKNAKDRYIPKGPNGQISNNEPGNLSVDVSIDGGVYTTGKTLKVSSLKAGYENSDGGKLSKLVTGIASKAADGFQSGGFTADIPVDKIAGVVHGGELNTGSR